MKYEYRVIAESYENGIGRSVLEGTLNLNGEEGWELVAVLGPTQSIDHHGDSFLYFFKRPVGGK
jgi:hypothetical protein